MLALIDADIVAHRVGFTTEDVDDFPIVQYRLDELLDRILVETNATEYRLFLSDSKENNFRYKVADYYKANRIAPKPKWHEDIKAYLLTDWNAEISYGQEADDSLGIVQTQHSGFSDVGFDGGDSVICSIDKDLMQIPGNHYNFVKQEKAFVTPERGLRNFYAQFLIGDTGDNIVGCRGIGPVKAGKALSGFRTDGELFDEVYRLYSLQHKDWGTDRLQDHLITIGRLLKIRQTEGEGLWDFPESSQIVASWKSSSTQPKQEETGLSTEHGGVVVQTDGFPPVGELTEPSFSAPLTST